MAQLRQYLWPSLAGAAVATLVTGLVDGSTSLSTGVVARLATAGFLGVFSVPLLFTGAVSLRLLWRWWQLDERIAARSDERGSCPALAAWLSYAVIATLVAMFCNHVIVLNAHRKLEHARVVSMTSALFLGVVLAVLIIASGPSARAMGRVFARLDRWLDFRWQVVVFRPRIIWWATLAGIALIGVATWQVVVKRTVGYLDISPLYLVLLMIAVCALFHRAALSRIRALKVATASACVLMAVAIACAAWVRAYRPHVALDVWGKTSLATVAVESLYDLQAIRDSFSPDLHKPIPRPDAGSRPDIVLITIDTLRADRTPAYGGQVTMPHLASLGSRGTTFQWAFSPGNVTRRSLPALALGLHPPRIRGRMSGWALRIDPRHVTLAERLRAGGYHTAGFFCCETQFGPERKLGLHWGIETIIMDGDGDQLAEKTSRWLRERNDARPLFAWIHLIEPHLTRMDAPTRKLVAQYKQTLEDVDAQLGVILEALERGDHARGTVIILTSDHGEGLGEHGAKHHASDLYNSQTRVPLIIAGPGIATRRYRSPVGLVDLAPTILDLAGFAPDSPPRMDGVSLVPALLTGQPVERPVYTFMIPDRSVSHGARAVIKGRYKYIEFARKNRRELYDIVKDPGERTNLIDKQPERARTLDALLEPARHMRPPF